MSAKTILNVKSRAPHFWRAGRKFTRAGVDVEASTLTAEQLDAIRNEPRLIVVETVAEEGGKAPPTTPTTPTTTKPTKAKR